MTDISVHTSAYQVEKRSWLISEPRGWGHKSVTIDVSTFTAGTHYPTGYIPSGTHLGLITATGLYGPYDDTASDGRQTAVGFLFGSVTVPNTADTTKDAGGALVETGVVRTAKLPFATDANGKADLAAFFKFQ